MSNSCHNKKYFVLLYKRTKLIPNQLTSFFINKQKKHSQEISKTKQIRKNVRTLQRKLEISHTYAICQPLTREPQT